MEALALVRKILVVLGLCIKDSENPTYGRSTNCIIFALLTGFLMITVDYIVTHFDDRENALYAIMQFVTFATVWTCYVCSANQKHLTFEFLNNIQEFVDNYCKFKSISGKDFELKTISEFNWQFAGREHTDFMKKLKKNRMASLNGHRLYFSLRSMASS